MPEELEKIIGGDDTSSSGEDKDKKPDAEQAKSESLMKEQEELENLRKAKVEAQEELRKIRQERKDLKSSAPDEEDIPRIDMDDPNAKAWDRHIRENVDPLQSELEKEKEEVVGLAFNEFLADRPALATNPEKRKELMETYQALARSKGITERNKDVVVSVMESAYGAVFHKEILERERSQRMSAARADGALADAATDGGTGAYRSDSRPRRRQLTRDETETAIRMYGSVDEYWKALEALGS